MAALDPELDFLLHEEGSGAAPLNALAVSEDAARASFEPSEIRLLLHFDGGLEHAIAEGFRVTSASDNVAVGFASPLDVKRIAAAEGVVLVEGSRPMLDELDVSLQEIRGHALHSADPAQLGAGVLIGIIDSGIDFTHQCFIREDGRTRVLAIWDQSLEAQGDEQVPEPFGYGVEYTEEALNESLEHLKEARRHINEAQSKVRHVDSRGHGTQVAGIAAGSGSVAGSAVRLISPAQVIEVVQEQPAGTFVGVAPEADLLIVAFTKKSQGIGESVELVDAIKYLLAKAEKLGRPIVINVSQGDYIGAHDGTTGVERYIDGQFGTGMPGRAIVKSAGNGAIGALPQSFEEAGFTHASGSVTQGGRIEVPFTVLPNDTNHDTIDLWYSGDDEFLVAIRQPDGTLSETLAPLDPTAEGVMLTLSNRNKAFIKSTRRWPVNGDNRINVRLLPGPAQVIEQGTWNLVLDGSQVTSGDFHAWIDRAAIPVPRFELPYGNNDCTISIPGTSRQIITIGSYVTRPILGDSLPETLKAAQALIGNLMSNSSRGPTRDRLAKPELAAPGEAIASARARASGGQFYVVEGGTSFAAPHVVGAIALLFQTKPDLTQPEIKKVLCGNARADQLTDALPHGFGAGKLDVKAAHDAINNTFNGEPLDAE